MSGITNQNNNFQNSENGTGQNFNNTNISYQVNNYFNPDNPTNSLYLSNQNKYLEYFINRNNSLKNMRFDKSYIIDFYFYFLSNFTKENNFEKSLNDYLLNEKKEKLKKNNIKKHLSFIKKLKEEEEHNELEFFLKEHFNSDKLVFIFDKREKEKNLIKEIESESQKKLHAIKNTLSFIEKWDNEMYFFINYLIKTDFELFINSNNDELLFHAIGFLFYSNNSLYIRKFLEEDSNYYYSCYNIRKVEEIYEFIVKNRNRTNKKFIKDIVLNPKKIYEYEQYDRINNFLETFKTQFNINDKINIIEIISNPDKLEEINKIMDKYEQNKSRQEINEIISKYANNLPFMESLRCLIEK